MRDASRALLRRCALSLLWGFTWLGALSGCTPKSRHTEPASRPSLAADSASRTQRDDFDVHHSKSSALPRGDAERGRALIAKFECNRCHDGSGLEPAAANFHCVNCHRQILAGSFPASRDKLARWSGHVRAMRRVPSLVALGARFEHDWVAHFLLSPYDLRPALEPSMPRLALSEQEASDIATFLGSTSNAGENSEQALAKASAVNGRRLLDARGCGSCHEFSGVDPLAQRPAKERARDVDALLLAPDLAHVRERWSVTKLVRFLIDPEAVKSDTLMPPTGFDEGTARDVAAYLLRTPLAKAEPARRAERLPILERPVTFAEVDARVLHVTCRHCHSDPDVSLGDGGPGNTGGFGFRGRRIDFSSYRGVLSGYRDDHDERHSLFEPLANGTPRLVAALLARVDEQAGLPAGDVRGMPLGLPALSLEQIQLVDSWIAQGRPR